MKRETLGTDEKEQSQAQGKPSDWIDRAHQFAVRILKMANHLPKTAAGRGMANQIVRSGPSIVHNLEEAKGAGSLRDTLHKTIIARKEAREVRRSLLLIRDSDLLPAAKLS